MNPIFFPLSNKILSFSHFLKYLKKNVGTDSPFPSTAAILEETGGQPLHLIAITTNMLNLNFCSPPISVFFLFYESLISRVYCSLSLQMPVYYYPSGQYPTSTTQQYRPIASVQYNAQRSQQIPQTAQQAGMYIWYSFLQLLTVPLLFCLKRQQKLEIENPFAWHPEQRRAGVASSIPADLPAVLLCPQCPCSKLLGTERAERELVSAVTPHVQATHCGCPPSWELLKCLYRPPWWSGWLWGRRGWLFSTTLCCACARGAAGLCVVGAVGAAAGSAVRLEGGPLHCKRVSSRSHSEPVSFPAVSHHSGWLQSKRDRGGELGWCVLGESRNCGCQGVVAFQGNKQFWCWKFLKFIYFLSVSLVHTFPYRVSQSLSPGVGGVGGRVGFAFPNDVPLFDLSLAETL